MSRKIAFTLSVLLHPLIIPSAGILMLLNSGTYLSNIPFSAKKVLILICCMGTFVLPALMIPVIHFRGIISGIHLVNRGERTTPLAITLIFYILTYYLFLQIPVYRIINGFMLGCVLCLFVSLLLSYRWKISIHMVGLGGLTALQLVLSFIHDMNLYSFLVSTILASGLAGSSRLFLEAHSPAEVYSGYFIGIILMSISLLIF